MLEHLSSEDLHLEHVRVALAGLPVHDYGMTPRDYEYVKFAAQPSVRLPPTCWCKVFIEHQLLLDEQLPLLSELLDRLTQRFISLNFLWQVCAF